MLIEPRSIAVLGAFAGLTLAACSSGDDAVVPAPTTSPSTSTTTTEVPERPDTIRIGVAINEEAPTAVFDAQIEAILSEAAITTEAATGISIDLRSVPITSPGQAEGSMLSLINDGVSVVITGCDDATIPSVVEAATANELLAVTGCVSLPRPDIDRLNDEIDGELFIDLSALSDNARAIATHATEQEYTSLAVVRSTLLPDVERVCIDLQTELASELDEDTEPEVDVSEVDDVGDEVSEVVTTLETTFVELVDEPADVIAELATGVGDLPPDAVVVCALPPTAGDIVSELRTQGFEQPIILPWYGDGQTWEGETDDVFIVTPASRYGDDPSELTSSLFEALTIDGEQPDAVDVVTADTLSILSNAAERAGSVGSQRIADAIRNGGAEQPIPGISGTLAAGGDDSVPVRRVYRVVAITNGEPAFVTEASAVDSDSAETN